MAGLETHVMNSLMCRPNRHDTADGSAGALHAAPPYYTTQFDFVLKPAK